MQITADTAESILQLDRDTEYPKGKSTNVSSGRNETVNSGMKTEIFFFIFYSFPSISAYIFDRIFDVTAKKTVRKIPTPK